METALTESTEGSLSCGVDGPLIMAAAAAFVLWKLNLEAEGSLPLSQKVPVLCSLLQYESRWCTNGGVASQFSSFTFKVMGLMIGSSTPSGLKQAAGATLVLHQLPE